jgi:signal transduction histidine kinase
MGLVGLVLLTVLAASVVSNYQTTYTRIEQAALEAVSSGLDVWQRPWIGRSNDGRTWTLTPSEPNGESSSQEAHPQTSGPFTPVYVVTINPSERTILSDNSSFVSIDTTLADEALTRALKKGVDARTETAGGAQGADGAVAEADGAQGADGAGAATKAGRSLSGLFFDLELFYHIEVVGDGTMTIALADASSLLDDTLQQTGISFLIWLGAMAIFFFISLLLSQIALRPAAEAWERQKRFVADASHELKTPLAVILANNSLLLAHPEKTIAEQAQWIDSTQAEAQRMDGLVRDLLLLAQSDEEEQGTSTKDAPLPLVDLSALTKRSLLQFEAVFFERGVSLMADVADNLSVEGNAEQLERLIQILLDNASKYAKAPEGVALQSQGQGPGSAQGSAQDAAQGSAQGSSAQGSSVQGSSAQDLAQPTIRVVLRPGSPDGQRVILTVANSGEVIDPALLPHLFERFYRADSAHSDTEGSGLGLSLAKAIVDAHHGSIEVASAPTDTPQAPTTTFTVTL